ncbi:hypothetical protein JKP88DRAFT_336121 [Tribonema minus]|uniref:Uncharacterized protein n=1 Tax=Tribonema minus TaxID=303371 RepID=A0A835YKJ4_9STRA|nr:hypothetical protein JKP88DRAFT_336121 [Tribonema minus]
MTSDLRLRWQRTKLSTARVDANGILNLEPTYCFNTLCPDIYVRDVYGTLYDSIRNVTAPAPDGSRRARKVLVTGSEGCGKSVVLFYFLWRLRTEGKTVVVEEGYRQFFRFAADGSVVRGSRDDFFSAGYFCEKDAWCLSDPEAEKEPYAQFHGVTVAFRPLEEEYFRRFTRPSWGPCELRYLPVWSEQEIEHCCKHLPAWQQRHSWEGAQALFAEWGGLVLFIERNNDLHKPWLQSACVYAAHYGICQAALAAMPEPREPNTHKVDYDMVFNIFSNDNETYHLDWASDYAKQRVLSRTTQKPEEIVAEFSDAARFWPQLGKLAGDLTEGFAKGELQKVTGVDSFI